MTSADRDQLALATEVATDYLKAAGFVLSAEKWSGTISGVSCTLEIPPAFPFVLPKVRVRTSDLRNIIPHVDQQGTVCIAENTGILLDSENPLGLLEETLAKASTILDARHEQIAVGQLADEFEAYWAGTYVIHSLCSPGGSAREVYFARVSTTRRRIWVVVADSEASLVSWAAASQCRLTTNTWKGYLVPLTRPFPLKRYVPPSVAELCHAVRPLVSIESLRTMTSWGARPARLPAWCIFSFPIQSDNGQGVFAAMLPRLSSWKGHRPQTLSLTTALRAQARLPVEKGRVVRLDPEYLRPRGGSTNSLLQFRIVLVGAGALGGFLAKHLVMAGIQHLHIIDKDELKPENAYRHLLGMAWVGVPKADALRDYLLASYPLSKVTSSNSDAATLVDQSIASDTILILATGEHTLELRISKVHRGSARLIHAWLDPLDIGHHVLVDGQVATGCLRCMYRIDPRQPQLGLQNRASFVKAGQRVTRTMGGCHGSFVPFSGSNADNAALDTLNCVLAFTRGDVRRALFSRFQPMNSAKTAGLELGTYATMFKDRDTRLEHEYQEYGCSVCGQHD